MEACTHVCKAGLFVTLPNHKHATCPPTGCWMKTAVRPFSGTFLRCEKEQTSPRHRQQQA